MEFVGHLLLGIFVGLIIFAALTFGFALFLWFMAFAAAVSAVVFLRVGLRRLWFLYHANDHLRPQKKQKDTHIIEVEYRDISDKE